MTALSVTAQKDKTNVLRKTRSHLSQSRVLPLMLKSNGTDAKLLSKKGPLNFNYLDSCAGILPLTNAANAK